MALVPLSITVTSDSICPFCYIGLRKLQGALAASPVTSGPNATLKPNIRFVPFQLDPTLPEDRAVNKRDRYIQKFGGVQRVAQMEDMMKARGREEGINFSYGGDTRGTTNSHRILHRTLTQLGPEKQLAVIDELFAAYFEHERDPADPELLADAAVHVGLFPDAPAARAYLDGTEDRADVEDQFRFAQMKGISGVPFFEITAEGVGARISGAQDREVFADVFGRIADKLRELGKLPEGAKASVDGVQADGPACAADGQTC